MQENSVFTGRGLRGFCGLLLLLLAGGFVLTASPLHAAAGKEVKALATAGKLVKRFPLGKLPDSPSPPILILSPDGRHAACASSPSATFLQIDDYHRSEHRYVSLKSIQFSRDGSCVLYGYGDSWNSTALTYLLFRDQKLVKTFARSRRVLLSPAGDNYISLEAADKGEEQDVYETRYHVLTKDRRFGPFRYVRSCQFSDDGALFGFIAGRDFGDYIVQINERQYAGPGYVDHLVFSGSGSRYAFLHVKDSGERKQFYNIGGKTIGPCRWGLKIHFSRDGSRHFFTADKGLSFLYGKVRLGPYQDPIAPVLTNDGRAFAFRFRGASASDTAYNCGLSLRKEWANIKSCCTFSFLNFLKPKEGVFFINPRKSIYLQYNREVRGPYDHVAGPVLTPDGNHIAYYFTREEGSIPHYDEREKRITGTRKSFGNFLFFDGLEHRLVGVEGMYIERLGLTDDRKKYCLAAVRESVRPQYLHVNGLTCGPFRAVDFKVVGNSIYAAAVTEKAIEIVQF